MNFGAFCLVWFFVFGVWLLFVSLFFCWLAFGFFGVVFGGGVSLSFRSREVKEQVRVFNAYHVFSPTQKFLMLPVYSQPLPECHPLSINDLFSVPTECFFSKMLYELSHIIVFWIWLISLNKMHL